MLREALNFVIQASHQPDLSDWDLWVIRSIDALTRHGEEVKVSSLPTIHLETGELREGMSASARIFFVYVTPTGAEIPITKCPHLTKVYGRTDGGFDGATRLTTVEYGIKFPCTIKMVNIFSVMGRPNAVANIFVDLNDDLASIELNGLEGFGKFKGRGKVDLKRSTFFMGRERIQVTDSLVKERFNLRTLLPSKKGGAGKPKRSLIF